MESFDRLALKPRVRVALFEIRQRLLGKLGIEEIQLFGSVARGDAGEESDIDLLVITEERLERKIRHEITGIIFEINLEYDTNFSTLVVDRESWDNGPFSVLPIHDEILREGILL